MKKIAAILLTALMAISLAACGGEKETTENTVPEVTSEPESNEGISETKILVAYFSATNTTEGVAKQIADSVSADIYEIVPEQPYTDADLDYHDDNSRSTIEMNDLSARPAISGSVEDMEQYSIVFIGYPNWWYSCPMAVFSFIEMHDLSGKQIYLFCSHGTGGFARSAQDSEEEQASAVEQLVSLGYNGNMVRFETGTVFKEGESGTEHMASFNYGYRLTAVRDWLFEQTK